MSGRATLPEQLQAALLRSGAISDRNGAGVLFWKLNEQAVIDFADWLVTFERDRVIRLLACFAPGLPPMFAEVFAWGRVDGEPEPRWTIARRWSGNSTNPESSWSWLYSAGYPPGEVTVHDVERWVPFPEPWKPREPSAQARAVVAEWLAGRGRDPFAVHPDELADLADLIDAAMLKARQP